MKKSLSLLALFSIGICFSANSQINPGMVRKAKGAVEKKEEKKEETPVAEPVKIEPVAEPEKKEVEAAPAKPAPKPVAPLKKFADVQRGMTDAKLETTALQAAQQHAKEGGWSENFTKSKIVSKEWIVRKRPATGTIINRTIDVAVYATWPDGHCSYQTFGFTQEFDGVKYGSLYFDSVGDQWRCECE